MEKHFLDEDGDLQDYEHIDGQMLYEEGMIDRNHYMGDHASDYGFTAYYSAKEKQLIYTMYFQGEETDTVLESELDNWYHN